MSHPQSDWMSMLFICHPLVILLEMQGRWPNLIFQLRVPPFEKQRLRESFQAAASEGPYQWHSSSQYIGGQWGNCELNAKSALQEAWWH